MPDLNSLGPSAAAVIIVLGFLKFLTTIGRALITALNDVALSNAKIVKEASLTRKVQERGFNEAKQRNGHLGEQNIKIVQTVVDGNNAIMAGLKELQDK